MKTKRSEKPAQAIRGLWHHGTSKRNAASILKAGFREGTYFAAHLEDAIAYGGKHVLTVAMSCTPGPAHRDNPWQVCLSKALSKWAIVGYQVYVVREVMWDSKKITRFFAES